MSTIRLKRYRHFPTLPDARALVALLHLHNIGFETRYQRGANFDRARHEPDRLEVWVRATDYTRVQQLEATLTREGAITLADNVLPDDQFLRISAKAPTTAAMTTADGNNHQPSLADAPTKISPGSKVPLLAKELKPWLFVLLTATLAALAYYWLK